MDYRQMAIINERKLKQENEELKQRIEELEAQNDYECECNKEFVATQEENERLKTLLYNVCGFIIEEMLPEDITEDWSKYQFGMTAEEHKKYIMGE